MGAMAADPYLPAIYVTTFSPVRYGMFRFDTAEGLPPKRIAEAVKEMSRDRPARVERSDSRCH
jgi:hypothetical protein